MATRSLVYVSCNTHPLSFNGDAALRAYLKLLQAFNRESQYLVRVLIIAPSRDFCIMEGEPEALALLWRTSIVHDPVEAIYSQPGINRQLEFFHQDFKSTARRLAARVTREAAEGKTNMMENMPPEVMERVRPFLRCGDEFLKA